MSNLHAQDKDVEELWKNQIDTGRVVFTKSMYLEINEQQVLDLLDRQPSFGMYKDNYFTTGIPINKKIDQYSADAKFQISIIHKSRSGIFIRILIRLPITTIIRDWPWQNRLWSTTSWEGLQFWLSNTNRMVWPTA